MLQSVNHQNQSLSILNFVVHKSATGESKCGSNIKQLKFDLSADQPEKFLQVVHDEPTVNSNDHEFWIPLHLSMHDCEYKVPADGVVDGYQHVKNATCANCAGLCKPSDKNHLYLFLQL